MATCTVHCTRMASLLISSTLRCTVPVPVMHLSVHLILRSQLTVQKVLAFGTSGRTCVRMVGQYVLSIEHGKRHLPVFSTALNHKTTVRTRPPTRPPVYTDIGTVDRKCAYLSI